MRRPLSAPTPPPSLHTTSTLLPSLGIPTVTSLRNYVVEQRAARQPNPVAMSERTLRYVCHQQLSDSWSKVVAPSTAACVSVWVQVCLEIAREVRCVHFSKSEDLMREGALGDFFYIQVTLTLNLPLTLTPTGPLSWIALLGLHSHQP